MLNASELLTDQDVAPRLNVSPGTLRNWRSEGKGPRWAVNPDTGRFIGYPEAAVDEWLTKALAGEVAS